MMRYVSVLFALVIGSSAFCQGDPPKTADPPSPNPVASRAGDALARSTWTIPTHDEVVGRIETWLTEVQASPEVRAKVATLWSAEVALDQRLARLAESFALVDATSKPLLKLVESDRAPTALRQLTVLEAADTPKFVGDHLRLLYGRWLAHQQLYNETLEQLGELDPDDVIDGGTLLFYQSVAYHRLLRKHECLPVVQRLLEKEDALPRRFTLVAQLIRDDIAPLKADSLDEIARLMESIRVRLGHGRAGTRVRKEEDDVIAKLDKLIEELEEQARQAASASQSSGQPGDNLQPAAPMQDSLPGGGTGPGNIDAKEIGSKSGWGDLPKRERQQALQDLGKEFPSHYRDVIEEFFRKLARDGAAEKD